MKGDKKKQDNTESSLSESKDLEESKSNDHDTKKIYDTYKRLAEIDATIQNLDDIKSKIDHSSTRKKIELLERYKESYQNYLIESEKCYSILDSLGGIDYPEGVRDSIDEISRTLNDLSNLINNLQIETLSAPRIIIRNDRYKKKNIINLIKNIQEHPVEHTTESLIDIKNNNVEQFVKEKFSFTKDDGKPMVNGPIIWNSGYRELAFLIFSFFKYNVIRLHDYEYSYIQERFVTRVKGEKKEKVGEIEHFSKSTLIKELSGLRHDLFNEEVNIYDAIESESTAIQHIFDFVEYESLHSS
ncbi:MAG: hypothetical protein GF317_20025 [Candidatus Lokiarchaeota archaeon]|nr:hypothetical protein [Candidatus Lokiarchaeota archaeon]